MKKYIIFDYDGTLHDTMHIYGNAFRRTYKVIADRGAAPKRKFTDREISIWLGYNSREMWEAFMPSLSADLKEKASRNIGRLMAEQIERKEAHLYPGALLVLQKLKAEGYGLVFLSNCKEDYMRAHRDLFHLDNYFDGFYCCETFDFIPKKEIFPVIAEKFPGSYMIVGDRFSDMEVAAAHNLLSIGCAYGFGEEEELKTADAIAEEVTQIPALVKRLWKS